RRVLFRSYKAGAARDDLDCVCVAKKRTITRCAELQQFGVMVLFFATHTQSRSSRAAPALYNRPAMVCRHLGPAVRPKLPVARMLGCWLDPKSQFEYLLTSVATSRSRV